MSDYPDLDQLAVINAAHAPNWMGHTLIQRVANQITGDCVEAAKSGDIVRAKTLAAASGKLQALALAPDFQTAYDAAMDMLGVKAVPDSVTA